MKNSVRIQRAIRSITQEELATALNVTRQTIIAIENGKYDPSLGLAFKISKFFDMRIEELFDDVMTEETGQPTSDARAKVVKTTKGEKKWTH